MPVLDAASLYARRHRVAVLSSPWGTRLVFTSHPCEKARAKWSKREWSYSIFKKIFDDRRVQAALALINAQGGACVRLGQSRFFRKPAVEVYALIREAERLLANERYARKASRSGAAVSRAPKGRIVH